MTNSETVEKFIHAVPLPTVAIGPDQTIHSLNKPAETLLGVHSVGRHYITALRQPVLLDKIESVFRDRKDQTARYLTREAGQDVTFSVTIRSAGDFLILVFQDMSASEGAGQMRRDFVANVSHELRTPLTALMGFIETLRGNARDDAAARERFLTIMEREAGRMTRIVDDLLSLSRVEADERIRPMERVPVGDILRSTLMDLGPLIESSCCEVQFNDDSGGVEIPADANQLRQVYGNLIENALKYGSKGNVIDVRLGAPKPEPSLRTEAVCLSVTDYGEGIAEHHIARLTERFYRVDSHRSRAIGGTGLGLAIVKHIVNRHRGRMRFESQIGKGTTVTVLLPTK